MSEAIELLNAGKIRLKDELNQLLGEPHVLRAFKIMGQLMDVMSSIEKLQSYEESDLSRKHEVIAKSKMAAVLMTQVKKIE